MSGQLLWYVLTPCLLLHPSISSAIKTPDDREEDTDDPEQQMRRIKMEYFYGKLYNPSIGAITKNYM